MQNPISSERNKSLFVPAGLSAIGLLSGDWVAMRTDSIDRTGLFIITKEYVKPRSVFDVLIWLGDNQPPIPATVTASFVERTWDGYGIWAQISNISTDSQAAWDRCYQDAALRGIQGYSEALRLEQLLQPQHVVVIDGALPNSVLDTLRNLSVVQDVVQGAERALELSRRGDVDLVILSLTDGRYDGIELCAALRELPAPPQSLALTERSGYGDFEAALHGGATKTIARPCSSAMLTTRILELLDSSRHPSRAERKAAARQTLSSASAEQKKRLAQLSNQVTAWWTGGGKITAHSLDVWNE